MSVDYASRLSKYENKGVCGVKEVFDSPDKLREKVDLLCSLLKAAQHVVVHTGAGISTAAGIPDFRGPRGVWTLEEKGEKVKTDIQFEDAMPTLTHRVLVRLVEAGMVKYVISQNVDGLHLKSNLPRSHLSELHGNMFMEICDKCGKEYLREGVVQTVGLKKTGNICSGGGSRGRCRGKLRDSVLDWDDPLPKVDLERAEHHSRHADLSLCLGTTLQIIPSGTLPLLTKKNGGKLVICNLQPTKYDDKADLVVHGYVDEVMEALMSKLGLSVPPAPLGLQGCSPSLIT
eukprot:Em0011g860a